MNFLLNSDDDWIENLRRNLYPELHPYLKMIGGYGTGYVTEDQYATTVRIHVEEFEKELDTVGFERNPIAAFKHHQNDPSRKSIGSWRLLPENDPYGGIKSGKQLHVTLLPSLIVEGGTDVYAHCEWNWEKAPFKHLRSQGLEEVWAADYMNRIVTELTYADNIDKND